MATALAELHKELVRRRNPDGFTAFDIVLRDGSRHRVRRPAQYAIRESDLVLISESGTTQIQVSDISKIEEKSVMTPAQSQIREELVASLDRSPFVPFDIQMNDGQTFHIVR